MEAYKLRVKIGTAEFEAEGAEDTVKAQFEEFKTLLSVPTGPQGQSSVAGRRRKNGGHRQAATAHAEPPADIPERFEGLFAVEDKNGRKTLSLRLLPQGEDRDSIALLLVLWGFKRRFGGEHVPVTVLKESLQRSGLTVERVDRVAEKSQQGGLVLKGGKGKGGNYALTNTGQARAEQEFKQLIGQM